MSAPRLFQFAKSTDPAVIATIERNRQGRYDWQKRACAFATAHGAKDGSFYPTSFGGRWDVLAINTKDEPTTGRWKRMRRGWAPYRNNPLAKEMDAIRFTCEPVPGLPSLLHSAEDPDWRHYVMTPTPFVHDGVAWLGLSHAPVDSDRNESFGPQWVECLASEYHAAREAITQ